LFRALGFGDDRAAGALGRHLPRHGLLNAWGRDDLADLHIRDLDPPPFGHLVKLDAQYLVDLLAFGKNVVQGHVADDRTKGGGRDVLCSSGEELDLDYRHNRVHDLVENDEIDRDRRVVLGDGALVRDIEVELAQVCRYRSIHEWDQQDDPGALRTDALTEPKDDEPLIIPDDPDHRRDQDHEQDHYDPKRDQWSAYFHVSPLGYRLSGFRPPARSSDERPR
jgi:hypothetical protein